MVLASEPNNSALKLLSIPITTKIFSKKNLAVSDPTKPEEPVTIAIFFS